MSRFKMRLAVLPLAAITILLLIAAACAPNQATTTASCAFVFGTGGIYDANLHYVVYPGQRIELRSGEAISYVPCNSRNYIVNDGTQVNANGDKVGDRHQLIEATTKTGVPITVAARALWTLNQTDTAMRSFYTVCHKYLCASPQDVTGDANFSTPGWNGMLAENMGPALDTAARKAAINVDDSIWQRQNPDQYQALSDAMSAVFADVMRANLGFPMDLFCGSGNSAWSDPSRPGEGEFVCHPVRIVVDDVQRGSIQADESAEGILAINKQRLENAQALYGTDASYWLGVQDTIDRCKEAGTHCVISVGGGSGQAVAIPVSDPTPIPVPAPVEEKKE